MQAKYNSRRETRDEPAVVKAAHQPHGVVTVTTSGTDDTDGVCAWKSPNGDPAPNLFTQTVEKTIKMNKSAFEDPADADSDTSTDGGNGTWKVYGAKFRLVEKCRWIRHLQKDNGEIEIERRKRLAAKGNGLQFRPGR